MNTDRPTLAEAIIASSRLIDSTYPPLTTWEERLQRRAVMKLGSELGEVCEAVGGLLAENPRKGRTHTIDDILGELLDVAAVALGAYEWITGYKGQSVPELHAQVLRKHQRIEDAIAEVTPVIVETVPVVDLMAALEESIAEAIARSGVK